MAQQLTGAVPFWPLFPRRSDGHTAVVVKGKAVDNGPSAEQLDRTPNAHGQSDYYRLISYEEPKHLDWRKKLGGMLMREMGGKEHADKWQTSLLWDFPEGYRLYEHIKSKVEGQAKSIKNHSGGGHDRQDAYLYGHPKGQKKRFRSPVEFFPHLLWLMTDECGDPDACTCKLCCPLQPEPEKETPSRQGSVVQTPARRSSVSLAASPAPKSEPRPTSQPSQLPARPAPAMTQAPGPTPLPQPRSVDQQTDAQYNKLLFRVGEVTWFQRDNTSWGLGVVIRRWIPKDGSSTHAYVVQPLSYPDATPAPGIHIVTDHAKLKPWLAWSPPACTFKWLRDNLMSYNQVPWPTLRSNQYGDGNPEVDASILATRMIDNSFTLFERLKITKTPTGQEERHWNGIYLGAEKIWNGEPARLWIGSGNDVLVITDIVESVVGPAQGGAAQRPAIHVIGDIYTTATIPAPNPRSPPSPPLNQHLPIRMREDMRWRNQFLPSHARVVAYWALAKVQARLDISELKGRWYETSLFFADNFNSNLKRGDLGNIPPMNNRGSCNNLNKTVGVRADDRLSAFGMSVPRGTTFTEGLDPPSNPGPAHAPPPQAQPEAPQQPSSDLPPMDQNSGATAETAFVLDDFMNLDNMGEDAMAFDQQYPFDQSAWPS